MYKLYKSDRLTYNLLAEQACADVPTLINKDQYGVKDPLGSIDLNFKDKNEDRGDGIFLLNHSIESEESIIRRKEKQLKTDREKRAKTDR